MSQPQSPGRGPSTSLTTSTPLTELIRTRGTEPAIKNRLIAIGQIKVPQKQADAIWEFLSEFERALEQADSMANVVYNWVMGQATLWQQLGIKEDDVKARMPGIIQATNRHRDVLARMETAKRTICQLWFPYRSFVRFHTHLDTQSSTEQIRSALNKFVKDNKLQEKEFHICLNEAFVRRIERGAGKVGDKRSGSQVRHHIAADFSNAAQLYTAPGFDVNKSGILPTRDFNNNAIFTRVDSQDLGQYRDIIMSKDIRDKLAESRRASNEPESPPQPRVQTMPPSTPGNVRHQRSGSQASQSHGSQSGQSRASPASQPQPSQSGQR